MVDVTDSLLSDVDVALGPLGKMLRRAAPAKKIEGSLLETWRQLVNPRFDLTIGYVSGPLLYSRMFQYAPKTFYRDVIRLLKGRFLIVMKFDRHDGAVPVNSNASRDNPRSDVWYEIGANSDRASEFPSL